MNAIILIIPFLVIRFGLFQKMDKQTLKRAATFAPLENNEKLAYYIYQITTLLLIGFPLFLTIKTNKLFFILGIMIYFLGIAILWCSMQDFAKPQINGLNVSGIYKISRNPIYVGYFIIFLACCILTHSILMLIILGLFQFSAHFIILSEERWCLHTFGDAYKKYMKTVRRYL